MTGAWIGVFFAVGFLLGIAALFHHYGVRLFAADAWLARGARLVDVDTAAEFAARHPRGALGVPLEELARRAHEIGGKERPVVVFAHSWVRAAKAVHALRGLGYWQVMNAAGARSRRELDANLAGPTDEPVTRR